MSGLSASALERLRRAADWPDLGDPRYETVEELGRGGMGAVYRVRDHLLERDAALKVLSLPDASGSLAARMLREARILAKLEHPGIVPIHDVGTLPDGRSYYVMKLVEGSRLDEYAGRGVPLPEKLRIFTRICETVAFAHARGIVHRDLKPGNVMVGAFGEVLVLDWGVARTVESAAESPGTGRAASPPPPASGALTESGAVVGTPGFMPPEQASGADVDTRADIYALGAMLSFLVAGTSPPSPARGSLPEPSLRAAGVPAPLRAICAMALAPERDDRYQSVERLSADVTAFLHRLPVAAYRESIAERAIRLAVKYRTPILLVLAYLVMRIAFFFLRGL